MGNTFTAAAKEKKDEAKKQLDNLLVTLTNKLEAFEAKLQLSRAASSSKNGVDPLHGEVTGGRTIMRVSEVRVATKDGVSDQITQALLSFFAAAQGGAAGEEQKAKKAAIEGAQQLLSAGINALFGVTAGQGMEKQSFVVLYMNNAFVRVDYFLYTYCASGAQWGAESSESGCCYMASMSVLDPAELSPAEIDFLLSQALSIEPEEINKLSELKLYMVEQAILSRALKNPDISFADLSKIADQLGECQKKISSTFTKFSDHASAQPNALLTKAWPSRKAQPPSRL